MAWSSAGRVFLSAGATDMRKSFNGLSGLVRGQLGSNPLSGDLFVLC
ncbi:MAG: IS66 family insertion sequence element accessory protein TnpB, partial [Planctomycetota bacterium]|nr:IS66 family insertion sequence element accessory protein TnpB [Planctomycetota bacterium]